MSATAGQRRRRGRDGGARRRRRRRPAGRIPVRPLQARGGRAAGVRRIQAAGAYGHAAGPLRRSRFDSSDFLSRAFANGRNVFPATGTQTLASIHGSFVRFQNGHFRTCPFIPREIRRTFEKMSSQERGVGFSVEAEHDAGVFLHSAVRRGYRDSGTGSSTPGPSPSATSSRGRRGRRMASSRPSRATSSCRGRRS